MPYLALRQLLQNYGPVPSSLLDHFQDEESKGIVRKITDQINEQDLYEPIGDMAFPNWDEAAKSFVLSMTKLDPKQRPTMKEVLEHPYLKDP